MHLGVLSYFKVKSCILGSSVLRSLRCLFSWDKYFSVQLFRSHWYTLESFSHAVMILNLTSTGFPTPCFAFNSGEHTSQWRTLERKAIVYHLTAGSGFSSKNSFISFRCLTNLLGTHSQLSHWTLFYMNKPPYTEFTSFESHLNFKSTWNTEVCHFSGNFYVIFHVTQIIFNVQCFLIEIQQKGAMEWPTSIVNNVTNPASFSVILEAPSIITKIVLEISIWESETVLHDSTKISRPVVDPLKVANLKSSSSTSLPFTNWTMLVVWCPCFHRDRWKDNYMNVNPFLVAHRHF